MILPLVFITCTVLSSAVGFQKHTALTAIVFTHLEPVDDNVHSEYYYGRCAVPGKTLLQQVKYNYKQFKNKMIIRGWLNVKEAPNCIYIRSQSIYADLVKYHAYKFNVCVCRLVYNYAGYIYQYFYFEWYVPVEMKKDTTWTLFFYTSGKKKAS